MAESNEDEFELVKVVSYEEDCQQENGGVENFPKHWTINSTYIVSQVGGESREIPRF